jgi:hypothetical protein
MPVEPLIAWWPVAAGADPVDVHKRAVADLPLITRDAQCRIVGPPAFRVINAPGVPLVLVAVAPAVRLTQRTGPCADNPERWYSRDPGVQAAAKADCLNACPGTVSAECLRDAMTDEAGVAASGRHGICGGCTPQERANLDPRWFNTTPQEEHCA